MDRKNRNVNFRELMGIFLLAGLFLAGLLTGWYLNRQHNAMAAAMEDGTWLALSGQWENAEELAASIRQDWEKAWRFRAAFSDHAHLEEIDSLFRELTVYGAAEEKTDFARTCAVLAEKLKALASSSRLSWWNVL